MLDGFVKNPKYLAKAQSSQRQSAVIKNIVKDKALCPYERRFLAMPPCLKSDFQSVGLKGDGHDI